MIRYKLKVRKSKIDTTPEIPEYKKYRAPTTLLYEFNLHRATFHFGYANVKANTQTRVFFSCLYASALNRSRKYPRLLTSYNRLAEHFSISLRYARDLIQQLQEIKIDENPLLVCRQYTAKVKGFRAKERPIEIIFTGYEHLQYEREYFYFKINLYSYKDKLSDAARLVLFMVLNSSKINERSHGKLETYLSDRMCTEWFCWKKSMVYKVLSELSDRGYITAAHRIAPTQKAFREE